VEAAVDARFQATDRLRIRATRAGRLSAFHAEDPFARPAGPAHYVPRRATELALTALEDHVRQGAPLVVLHGPEGIGKSLLLRVLAERCRAPRVAAVLPDPAPAPDAIERAVMDQLDPERPAAEGALAGLVAERRAAGGAVAVVVDEWSALPPGVGDRLVELAGHAGVSVVATVDGDPAHAALPGPAARVALDEPLDRSEAASYVRVRMMRAGVPIEARARLDRPALDWVLDGTEGLPGRINERAGRWLASLEADARHGFDEALPRGHGSGAVGPEGLPLPRVPGTAPPGSVPAGRDPGRDDDLPDAEPEETRRRGRADGPTSLAGGLRTPRPRPRGTPRPAPRPAAAPAEEEPAGRKRAAAWLRGLGWGLALAAGIAAILWIRSLGVSEPPPPPPPLAQPPPLLEPEPLAAPEPAPEPVAEVPVEPPPPPEPPAEPEPEVAAVAATPPPRPAPAPPPAAPARRPAFVLIDEMGTDTAASSYVRLRIDAAPGDRIAVDGEPVGEAPVPDLLVAPGVHVFTARDESGFEVEQVVEVSERSRIVEF